MKILFYTMIVCSLVAMVCPPLRTAAQVDKPYHWVVAQDGSGDFTTIQAAILAVPDMRKAETRIYIKKGVYREKVIVPESKQMVTLIGESASETVLSWDDYASRKNVFDEEMGTSATATIFIYGQDFTAINITFENTAGRVGQAVAVFAAGDRARFYHCRLLGHQDTLYTYSAQSRQYFFKCHIEGTTDFIFGSSVVFFDSCTIYGKAGGHYYTAASTPEANPYGYVFRHCRFTGDAPRGTYHLGRPWRPYAKTVLIHCEIGPMVKPEGWHNWNKPDAERTSYYAEYNSRGDGYKPGQRVSWSHQLTSAQAALYTPEVVFRNWVIIRPEW